eukprot:GEMP01021878.1.p1 GENE.GEMP01021878.1~~GEMP01021878.1.p1  ORF type:complete len:314 (+),score=35.98 GEMP01021878.1:229-1170(+)
MTGFCCKLVGQCCRYVPIGIVTCIISFLYGTFMFLHIAPALEKNPNSLNSWLLLAVFQVLAGMASVSFIQAIQTSPGHVPDTEEWFDLGYEQEKPKALIETKHSGELRYCKWCGKFKPDRCHHCRVCKRCVLKMDHHCPWISNCVGFNNYKYFFTHLVYCSASSIFIVINLFPTMMEALNATQASPYMMVIVSAESMALFMALLVTPFLMFHSFLLCSNMTTIEYCEKATKYRDNGSLVVYDVGCYANISASIGPWYLWLLPVATAKGNGLSFAYDESTPLVPKKRKERYGSGRRKDRSAGDADASTRKNTLL